MSARRQTRELLALLSERSELSPHAIRKIVRLRSLVRRVDAATTPKGTWS